MKCQQAHFTQQYHEQNSDERHTADIARASLLATVLSTALPSFCPCWSREDLVEEHKTGCTNSKLKANAVNRNRVSQGKRRRCIIVIVVDAYIINERVATGNNTVDDSSSCVGATRKARTCWSEEC